MVICNETLLQPLLHNIPEQFEEVNVTKGFPLGHTEAVALVESALGDFERRVTPLTTEEMLSRLLQSVEKAAKELLESEDYSPADFDQLLQSEAYYVTTTILNRLLTIARQPRSDDDAQARPAGRLDVGASTLRKLIRQIVRQATIPFSGEPAVGLQVMGVLETRCLDFEHLIMLSVNEGSLPQTSNDNSFIPYLLRKEYRLTTPERRTAVYAYYFYRLIQRAKRVRLVYNTSSEGLANGEMSRFLTQLMAESNLPIRHIALTSDQHNELRQPKPVPKPANLVEILIRPRKEGEPPRPLSLSPSAINTYMRCQLSYYYKYVERLHEPNSTDGEMKANTLGSIFHNAIEIIYRELTQDLSKPINNVLRDELIREGSQLSDYVKRAYKQVVEAEQLALDPEQVPLVEGRVVEMFLRNLLKFDKAEPTLEIQALEQAYKMQIDVNLPTGPGKVEIGGTIDRVDTIAASAASEDSGAQRVVRIIDYKTGGKPSEVPNLDAVFTKMGKGQFKYPLQTLLYGLMYSKAHPEVGKLAPGLLYVHQLAGENKTPYLNFKNKIEGVDTSEGFFLINGLEDEIEQHLQTLLNQIFDLSVPFAPIPEDDGACKTCAYHALCYL